MGSYPWFRTYSDELNDVSINRLSDRLYRTFKKLECLANLEEPRGRLPDDKEDLDEIAHRIRQSPRKTRADLDELERVGLLERDPKTKRLMPSGWDDMQKKSDSSAPRVAAHRARKQAGNVTGPLPVTDESRDMKQAGNGAEGEEDVDVESDEEADADESRPDFAAHADFSAANAASEVLPVAKRKAAPRGNGPASVSRNGKHATTLPNPWSPSQDFWQSGERRYGAARLSAETQRFREQNWQAQTTSANWDAEWFQFVIAKEASGELIAIDASA